MSRPGNCMTRRLKCRRHNTTEQIDSEFHRMEVTKDRPKNVAFAPREGETSGLTSKDVKKYVCKYIWVLCCLFGSLYQTVTISETYFKYPVSSQVTIKTETYFFIPAISFCFPTDEVLLQDLELDIDDHDNDQKDRSTGCGPLNSTDCTMIVYNHYSIATVMKNLTVKLQDYFDALFFENNGAGKRVEDEETRKYLKIFFKSGKKCIRININQKKKVNYDRISQRRFDLKYILSSINWKNMTEVNSTFFGIIHQFNTFPRGHYMSYFEGDQHKFDYSYTYKMIRTEFLPVPYFSKCVHYEDKGLETREQCIERCVQHKLSKENSSWTDLQITITDFSDGKLFLQDTSSIPERNRTALFYNQGCRNKCHLQCEQIRYIPNLLKQTKNKGYDHFTFDLYVLEPSTIVSFSPKLTFMEYVIYLASIISLWFGFVFLDAFQFIKIHFGSLKLHQVNVVNIIQQKQSAVRVNPEFIGNVGNNNLIK